MSAPMCRVCLGANIRLIRVANRKLIETYENLTSSKLNTGGMADVLCYICHTQLQKCHKFANMAHKSEAFLRNQCSSEMSHTSTLIEHSLTHNLTTSPIQLSTFTDEEESTFVTVKIEQEEPIAFHFLGIEETALKTDEFISSKKEADEDSDFEAEYDDKVSDGSTDDAGSKSDDEGKEQTITEPSYVFCDFCNKKFPYKYRLMVHLRTHIEKTKRIPCKMCKQTFTNQTALKTHLKTHEVNDTGTETFSCKVCLETFSSKVRLTSHILSHTGEWQFPCDICHKTFSKPADLKRHTTQAHAPNSFSCSVCNREFNKHASLKAHVQTHTAKRIHICNICDKGFSVPANLKRHIHTHKEERPTFPCPTCSKVYSHKHHLRDHLRTHNGEKPYICKICDKAFSYASTLRNHMVIHTGEKPFVCHKCHSPFSQSSTLRRHLRLIHNIK